MKFHSLTNRPISKGLDFTKSPSLTQQEWKESQSIDSMIRRCMMGDASVWRRPQFADVLSAPESFHDAQNKLALARSVWNDMPDKIRATYGSPEALVAEFDRLAASEREKLSQSKPDVSDVNKSATPTNEIEPSHSEGAKSA